MKECVLEMRAGRPVIIYRITYDDGEEVASAVTAHSLGLPLIHSDVSPNPNPNPNLDPNPNPTQVAEDLRKLPARMVREEMPEEGDADVQCVEQWGSMPKRVGWRVRSLGHLRYSRRTDYISIRTGSFSAPHSPCSPLCTGGNV